MNRSHTERLFHYDSVAASAIISPEQADPPVIAVLIPAPAEQALSSVAASIPASAEQAPSFDVNPASAEQAPSLVAAPWPSCSGVAFGRLAS